MAIRWAPLGVETAITYSVLVKASFSNSWLGGEFVKRELEHRCPIAQDGECTMLHSPPVSLLGILTTVGS